MFARLGPRVGEELRQGQAELGRRQSQNRLNARAMGRQAKQSGHRASETDPALMAFNGSPRDGPYAPLFAKH